MLGHGTSRQTDKACTCDVPNSRPSSGRRPQHDPGTRKCIAFAPAHGARSIGYTQQKMTDSPKTPAVSSALDRLRSSTGRSWTNIATAAKASREKMAALTELSRNLLPTDEGAFVVFGSLARSEFTTASDL